MKQTHSNNTSASKKSNLSWCHRATIDATKWSTQSRLSKRTYCNPGRRQRQVSPLPLMPSPRTNRTHLKSPPPIKGSAKNIRICSRTRPPWLHDMKKPFAPLGCAIEACVKPEDRRTWDTRSDAGFSLGTSMQHHRCFRVDMSLWITNSWSGNFYS